MSWICKWIGHRFATTQSHEIISFVGPDHWCWPGVITFCPRCGHVYTTGQEVKPPFLKVKP